MSRASPSRPLFFLLNPPHLYLFTSGTATQAAQITQMHPSVLRSGERGLARLHFKVRPEYVKPGLSFIFRSGHTRGVGTVLDALTFDPTRETFVVRGGGKARRNTK